MKYKNLLLSMLLVKGKAFKNYYIDTKTNNKININANNKINSKKNIAKSVILTTLTTKQAIDIANKVFIPIPESRRLINSILFTSITSLLINTHEDFKNIYTPVEPKPPLPRIVSPSSSTESTSIT
tara:strand:+ start:31 stop:408 length:378 start_codon:yes stop_codon:yes gene_type:complete